MVGGAVIEINRLASRDALRPVWTELEARSDAPFFLSWAWIGTWLEASSILPFVVTARRGGRVVALALVAERRRRRCGVIPQRVAALHETGDAALDGIYIEYNGVLRDRGEPDSIFAEMLLALTAPDRDWDELRLSAIDARAAGAADATGWIVARRAASRCFAVDLAALRAQGTAYVDSLGASTRQQLRRTRRLYEAQGALALTPARSLAEAKTFLADLKALHQRSWRQRGRDGAFATPQFERFHDLLLERLWPRGGVELLKIAAGAHVIGYLYNFLHRDGVLNYQSGFAAVDDNRLKPGLLSHALCVEHHLSGRAARYDLMAGEARYKQNLAAPHAALVWLTLTRPTVLARLAHWARRLKHALARHPNSLA